MSFILEALKKSDQKRQDGTVPRLETVHRSVSDSGAQRLKWLLVLLLVLSLNASVLLWLFGPWQQQKLAAQDRRKVPAVAETPATVSQPPVDGPKTAPVEERRSVSLPADPVPAVREVRTPPAVAQTAETKPVAPASDMGRQKPIYPLVDLPLAVRREIPELHMSLHAFNRDSAAASLIRVNGKIMREGDQLAGKFLLAKITAEGAVFRFQDYMFLVPRKGQTE